MDLMVWKYRFGKERYQTNLGVTEKMGEFHRSTEKGLVWRESEVDTKEEGVGSRHFFAR